MTGTATTCECGGSSAVDETRPAPKGTERRRRHCLTCGAKWTTYEKRADEGQYLAAVARHVDQVCGSAQWVAMQATKWFEP